MRPDVCSIPLRDTMWGHCRVMMVAQPHAHRTSRALAVRQPLVQVKPESLQRGKGGWGSVSL